MKAVFYVQVEPEFGQYSYNRDSLHAIHARRITKNRPESPMPGSVVVKLTIDIPDAAFLPLKPEATITIPVEHTAPVAVESEPVNLVPAGAGEE